MPGGAQSQRQLTALIPAGAWCRLSCGDDPKDLRLQDRALIAAIDRTGTRSGPGLAIAWRTLACTTAAPTPETISAAVRRSPRGPLHQPGGGAAPERSRL
jgi:hypothetical protein